MNLVCAHLEEDWELFALGALDEATQRDMKSHLQSGCRKCRSKFMEARTAMLSLSSMPAPAQPSARAERELMRRIRQESLPAFRPERRWSWKFAPWVLAAACLLVAFALFWQQRGLRMELSRADTSIASLRRALTAQPAVSQPSAESTEQSPVARSGSAQDVATPSADRKKLDAFESQLASLQQDNAALQAAHDQAAQRAATLQADLASAQARTEILARDLAAAQTAVVATKPNVPDQGRIADLDRQLVDARSEISRLQQANARNEQVEALLQSGSVRQIELRAVDPAAGTASAHVLYSPRGGLLLVADSLPRLDHEKCYQLWVIRKGAPAILSAGLLQTSADGRGFLFAPPTNELAQLAGLAITDEPKGGSVSARGHKLLFGAQ